MQITATGDSFHKKCYMNVLLQETHQLFAVALQLEQFNRAVL